ncbi:MAG: response regulator [Elusimicrobia bacterium]|nr:response regulator [Elusimicrobiota bacterium]
MPATILVVDDDPAFLEFVCLRLRTAGYKVISCGDGLDAIKLAKANRPQVIVLDIMMPNLHGYEVCRALRADETLNSMKILIVSAKGYKSDMDSAKAVGADHYLVKPFDSKELIAVIEKWTEVPSSRKKPDKQG